jgi:hypothetical protein
LITVIALVAIGVAFIIASVFACIGSQGGYNPYGTNANEGYAGGMMGGAYSTPQSPAQSNAATPAYPYQSGMGGCRGGWNGYAAPVYQSTGATATPITIETGATIAQQYLTQLNNPALAVREVEEYKQNFYVQVYEKSTGAGAFELLINKYTSVVTPEMGPNMMWNTVKACTAA